MKLRHTPISLQAGDTWLAGDLFHAPNVRALVVLLVAGEGEDSAAAQDAARADCLQAAGFATLQLNLLSAREIASGAEAAFDIPRLSRRLDLALAWLAHQPHLASLRIALVASGTASAAAIRCLAANTETPDLLHAPVALVVWSGRADLAGAAPLRTLRTPTRFVLPAGDADADIARRAYALIEAELADCVVAPDFQAGLAAMLDWLQRQFDAGARN